LKRFKIKEVHRWLNNLPENKWRKIYKVDAKRVAHFINHGGNVELPVTLRRKYGDTGFVREKKLAKGFLLHKIDEKKKNESIITLKQMVYEELKKLDRSGILRERLSDEGRELRLFIDNDAKIYKSRYIPILKNLSKFKKRNKFNPKLAVKAFKYLVDDGAKSYAKNYGGDPRVMFAKNDRLELAKDYAEEFETQFNNKEFDFMK
tara:strand:+ start:903 stop:1517 length:615 start_codon:yes stop_codon:yes gene_type:complete